jgi:hypothetical protein
MHETEMSEREAVPSPTEQTTARERAATVVPATTDDTAEHLGTAALPSATAEATDVQTRAAPVKPPRVKAKAKPKPKKVAAKPKPRRVAVVRRARPAIRPPIARTGYPVSGNSFDNQFFHAQPKLQ